MADLTDNDSTLPVKIIGANSSGVEGTPLNIANGSLYATLRYDNGNEVIGIQTPSLSIPTIEAESPTFYANGYDVVIGQNKSMLSIVNAIGSGSTIRIQEIKIVNAQTSGVTGVIAEFRLLRCTGHSVGTLLDSYPADSSDVINPGITVRTGGAISGESLNMLKRWKWSSDEYGTGTTDVESFDHALQNLVGAYIPLDGTKSLALRPGEGLTIKQITNSAAGSFDIIITFTQE